MAAGHSDSAPVMSNRLVVFQAIRELCALRRQASRQAVADLTGLKMSIVDDHVKNLKDDEVIRQVVPGIFEPVFLEQERAVSFTIVPGGSYKLEVGDQVMDLTLREARNVGLATAGLGTLMGR